MPPKSNNDKRKEVEATKAGKSANVVPFRSSYDKSKKRPGSENISSSRKIQRCSKFSKLDKDKEETRTNKLAEYKR